MGDAALHDDVASVARRIEATFGQDFEGWKACFDLPCKFVTPQGAGVLDADTAEEDLPVFARLREAGFARTRLDWVAVRVLTPVSALLDTTFTRVTTGGDEMEKLGALYVCRLTDAGWLAATVVGHPHDEPVVA